MAKRSQPAQTSKAPSVPKEMKTRFDQIVALIDPVCTKLLNDEYRQVCHDLTATLCRKRPSPLNSGRLDMAPKRATFWAASIVHVVGSVNFLYDRSQTPHVTLDALCAAFGTSKTTIGSKATQIKKLLKIGVMDPDWTLPSRMESNPMAWSITVNGLIVDARYMPLDIQLAAFRKGLIPYAPSMPDLPKDASVMRVFSIPLTPGEGPGEAPDAAPHAAPNDDDSDQTGGT